MAAQPKQIHERSCIACGTKASKKSMYRVVRTKDGQITFDAKGNVAGRGAYVCSLACLTQAASGRLARALKTTVSAGKTAELVQSIQNSVAAKEQAIGE